MHGPLNVKRGYWYSPQAKYGYPNALYENTRIFIRLWAFNMPKNLSGTSNYAK
jgi:hypothetical protein